MNIIAICGYKGSGKDAVGNIIQRRYHGTNKRTVRKVAFADKIKNVLMSTFLLKNKEEYDDFKRNFITMYDGRTIAGRDILRSIGMYMRSCDEEQFIDNVNETINKFKAYHPEEVDTAIFVITDLRFKNEVKWCRANGVPIIKVKRDTSYFDGHISEMEIDDFLVDYIVDNNGSEDELKAQVYDILDKIIENK